MKRNRVILFIITLLVIVTILVIFSDPKGTYSDKEKNFAVEDTSMVTKIFLANKSDRTVLLERPFGGNWTVNQKYDASPAMMQLFLETLTRIRVKSPVPQKSSEFIFKRMSSNATKVEIYEKCFRINLLGLQLFPHEKMTRCYYVGDPTQDNLGTFMLMDGAKRAFVVHLPGFRGFVSTRYNVLEKNWRSHQVCNLTATDIQSVTLDYPQEPYHAFAIDINDNNHIDFRALLPKYQPTAVDTLKVYNYLNSFRNINFETILNGEIDPQRMDSIIQTVPINVLTLTTKSGNQSTFRIFPMISRWDGEEHLNPDKFYIYTEDGDFLLAQYFVFDKILRQRDYFKMTERQ